MSYRICKDEKPQEWDGTHYLTCIHTLNSHSHIDFLMYCNILKKMPNGRLKIRMFGYRWSNVKGEKIRYIDSCRVRKSVEFN